MKNNNFESNIERGDFQIEYPDHADRKRKRPAARFDEQAHEDLSLGLIEVLSKIESNLGGSSSSASSIAQPLVEPSPAASAYIDRGLPLPDGYGLDRLVALVRDPEWVFTYWELNGPALAGIKAERGESFVNDCAWVLRVYRVDENSAVDMEIEPNVGGWYVQVGTSGRYVFEMALLSPEGEWLSLLVSTMLGAPYAGVSSRIDEEWRLLPDEEAALSASLRDALDLQNSSSKGGSSGPLGSSRLMSSFSVVSSRAFLGGSESGRAIVGVGFSSGAFVGASGVSSGGGVAGSWHFPGSSGHVPGSGASGGSGGFSWIVAPTGAHEPQFERPSINGGGPNWNTQPALPQTPRGKSQQGHFKVKLPRVLYNINIPRPTWPPRLVSSTKTLKAS